MILPPLRAYLIPFAVLLLIIAMGRARAADPSTRVTVTMTCRDVQAIVTLVGGWATLARLAEEGGATKRQIEEVMRCRE